jgi:transcriptional regulator with XRE-family HTH domain
VDESLDVAVGRRVHMLMWDQKLSQTALSKRLGIAQTTLSKKLHGERGWSLDDLQSIAGALHVSMAYLLGESNVKAPPRGGGDDGGASKKADPVSERQPLDYKVGSSAAIFKFRPRLETTPLRIAS